MFYNKIYFFINSSMFGAWPGNDQMFDFLKEPQKKYPVETYDFSEVCKDCMLYFDHRLFNFKGISWFTEKYIELYSMDLSQNHYYWKIKIELNIFA